MLSLIQKIIQHFCVSSRIKFWFTFFFIFGIYKLNAQDINLKSQKLKIEVDTIYDFVKVQQKIQLQKTTDTDSILFYAWANAFVTNSGDLNKRLLENYKLDLHFTPESKRGSIIIDSIILNGKPVSNFKCLDKHKDILNLHVEKQQRDIELSIFYTLHLPKNKFTGYGKSKNDILLKEFYFVPIVDLSKIYHQMNLEDLPEPKSNISFYLENIPSRMNLYTNFLKTDSFYKGHKNLQILFTPITLDTFNYSTKKIFITPIYLKKTSLNWKRMLINKIMGYFEDLLGEYPENTILITDSDLKNYPLYGPDWLPDFINPFDASVLWEFKILHQVALKYADQMQIDKRKNPWLYFSIASFAEFNYINKYYPHIRLMGKLSKHKIFKYYYITQAPYREKYPFLYRYMARINKDQSLITPLDSLSNFNKEAANPLKMALGMEMLKEKEGELFFDQYKKIYHSALIDSLDADKFYKLLKIDSDHWFRKYISTRKKYDYSIKIKKKNNDSLVLKIKNKRQGTIPIQVFALTDSTINKIKDLPPVKKDTILYFKLNPDWEYIGVNYYNQFPEIQIHNNYKKINSGFLNKPLQIRILQDLENPLRNQIFINPYFKYNYYDGIILGTQIYNKGILHNHFNYSVSPSFSLKAKNISGSFSVSNTHYFESLKPFAIRYGLSGSYFHYNFDLTYTTFKPYISVAFHAPDIRARKNSRLTLSYMYINKEMPDGIKTPDSYYKIVDLGFYSRNVNVIMDRFLKADLQFESKFGKLSGSYRLRWLTDKTRQMDIRFFAGMFLYNNTDSDYFSFALDRPTDYLFQYNYYGRSETTGIFHQQFIWAEGGFKTFFEDQYANQWLISNNINIGLWKWFNMYGDWAYKKNKYESPKFYYDSGFRINLVQDYFEIFFPMYSSKGFEPQQEDYIKKIRLVFTIDLPRLQKMFTRGWY